MILKIKLRLSKLLTSLLILCLLFSFAGASAAPTPTPAPTLPPFDESVPVYDEEHPENLSSDQLYSQAFLLMDWDSGKVLMEKNADVRMNPASTTKVLTLLVAVEAYEKNDWSLYNVITIPEEASQIANDSSVVPVTVGEQMTMLDLMYGMMLRSGNDAAMAIAKIVAGDVPTFVDMMNRRAQELGCTGTHFSNPHGYTSDDHYTTVRDMALITQAAMQHQVIRKIVGTGQYTMAATDKRKELIIENSNLLVVYGSKYRYSGATGVKTGTTSAAGQCLISSAERDGIRLLAVCFKSTTSFVNAKWQDATRLLDYGYSRYKTYSFSDLYGMTTVSVPISGAAEEDPYGGVVKLNALVNCSGTYEVTIFDEDIGLLLKDFTSPEKLKIEYTRELTAPIDAGTVIGKLTFDPDPEDPANDVITAILVSDRAVEAAPRAESDFLGKLFAAIPTWVYILITVLAAILLFVIVLKIINYIQKVKRRRARKKARMLAAKKKKMQKK